MRFTIFGRIGKGYQYTSWNILDTWRQYNGVTVTNAQQLFQGSVILQEKLELTGPCPPFIKERWNFFLQKQHNILEDYNQLQTTVKGKG